MKDYSVTAPSIKEVYKNPWLIFTTFFGAGCLTPGPGTWGSFAAWLAFLILEPLGGRGLMWILTILCFIVGVIAIPKCEAVLKNGSRFNRDRRSGCRLVLCFFFVRPVCFGN